jgi:hypothetical protein
LRLVVAAELFWLRCLFEREGSWKQERERENTWMDGEGRKKKSECPAAWLYDALPKVRFKIVQSLFLAFLLLLSPLT